MTDHSKLARRLNMADLQARIQPHGYAVEVAQYLMERRTNPSIAVGYELRLNDEVVIRHHRMLELLQHLESAHGEDWMVENRLTDLTFDFFVGFAQNTDPI